MKFIRRLFYALVLLVPVMSLPWTVSPLEVNKQALFYGLSMLIILAWLGQSLLARSIEVGMTKIWWPLVAFLLFIGISTGLSHESYLSIFGNTNQEYTSAITMVLMLGLAFVAAQSFDASSMRRLSMFGLISSSIVGVSALLSYVNITIGPLPSNLIGTPNALAIYLLAMAILGGGYIIVGVFSSKAERTCIIVTSVITTISSAIVLLAIDYSLLWIVVLIGSIGLFALSACHSSLLTKPIRFVMPMILLVCSLFFLVLPTVIPNPFPLEVSLNSASSLQIVKQTLENGSWAFGTGPGTFVVDFTQYRSADLNQTAFWDTRFDRASSGLLTTLPTMGIFATIALLIGLFMVTMGSIRTFYRSSNFESLPIVASSIVIIVAWFCYPQNFVLTMMLWLSIGLLVAIITNSRLKHFTFDQSPRAGFVAAFGFVLCAVFLFTVGFATVARYRSEVAFAQALAFDKQGGKIDDIIKSLDEAASMNKWSDVAYRNLASALLSKVSIVVQDKNANPDTVRNLIGAAINASVQATNLGPTNVTNWELRGDVYRSVSSMIPDAASFSIASYQRAIELAPNNPRYFVSLARGYLAEADQLTPIVKGDDKDQSAKATELQVTALQNANDALLKAITFKSDYADARYYLASVQERQNKLADAVASMELVRSSSPNDIGIGLQLSLFYLRQGKNDLAKQELQRIIAIAPNFSNAHWYLSSILEKTGDVAGAIAELQIIVSLDPTNVIVQKKIADLQAGQKASTIPEPLSTTP